MCSVLCRTIVYRVTLVQSSEFSLILPSLFYCTVTCDDIHSFPFLPYSLSTYLSLFHTVSLHLSSLISFSLFLSPSLTFNLSLSPCLSSSLIFNLLLSFSLTLSLFISHLWSSLFLSHPVSHHLPPLGMYAWVNVQMPLCTLSFSALCYSRTSGKRVCCFSVECLLERRRWVDRITTHWIACCSIRWDPLISLSYLLSDIS